MATRIQFRRGTTAQHATFTGAVGEMTVDTDKDCVVVHDGSTAGGFEMARADGNNIETNAITATHLNVSGNGSNGQYLRSDGDGSFTWASVNTGNMTKLFSGSHTSNGNLSTNTNMTQFDYLLVVYDLDYQNSTNWHRVQPITRFDVVNRRYVRESTDQMDFHPSSDNTMDFRANGGNNRVERIYGYRVADSAFTDM